VDLTTSTTEIFVVVEAFPECKKGLGARLGTSIKQNAYFRVQNAANGGKKPSVRVDLLCVLLLETKHHLHRREGAGAVVVRADKLLVGRNGQLGSVFELQLSVSRSVPGATLGATYNVSDRLDTVNILLHDTILVDADGGKQIQCALVTGVDAVEDEADDNLLPRWATLVPKLGLLEVDDVADVLHNTVQGTGSEDLVFVVVGDGDEQLRVTVVHGRAQIVAILQGEVVGVARGRRVWRLLVG